MNLLNLYSQKYWHDDAFLVANRDGLLALRAAINNALMNGIGKTDILASDGNGYTVHIAVLKDSDYQTRAWQKLKLPYTDESARDKRESTVDPGVLTCPRRDPVGYKPLPSACYGCAAECPEWDK